MARKLGGIQIKNVAAHFRRDPVVIGQGIKKLGQRLREETPVIRAITKLEAVLTSLTYNKNPGTLRQVRDHWL